MKTLNESFDEGEYEELVKAKGELTWREWMLLKAREQNNKKKKVER